MPNLSDRIEDYLRRLIALSNRNFIDIRRNELAEKFSCVPSQINYVLATRFTPGKGYLVESRRGGCGYVRIARVNLLKAGHLLTCLEEISSAGFGTKEANDLIERFYEERIITLREARMVQAALETVSLVDKLEKFRGELLKNMLIAALKGY